MQRSSTAVRLLYFLVRLKASIIMFILATSLRIHSPCFILSLSYMQCFFCFNNRDFLNKFEGIKFLRCFSWAAHFFRDGEYPVGINPGEIFFYRGLESRNKH